MTMILLWHIIMIDFGLVGTTRLGLPLFNRSLLIITSRNRQSKLMVERYGKKITIYGKGATFVFNLRKEKTFLKNSLTRTAPGNLK